MARLMRDRPNPYSSVDPLLAFVFGELESAERSIEYRQEELEDVTERARRLREIFTLLAAQRRQSGAIPELPPPPPARDRGSAPPETPTAEVLIELEPGKAIYPMPPHGRIISADLARRDPRQHPDAAFTPVMPFSREALEGHKKWVAEEQGHDDELLATPASFTSDPTAGTVEFYPSPNRGYFVRIVYRPAREQ